MATGPVRTEIDLPELTEAQTTRMKALEEELRCLVCQNQTLAESGAELAGDLRNQVHEQIAAGKSNVEIKAYLVARYGDFVLYRPPVQGNTAMLWAGPFALLGVGAASWFLIQRRQRLARSRQQAASSHNPAPVAGGSPAVAADKLEQARRLLDD